jgi:hypothetical protein
MPQNRVTMRKIREILRLAWSCKQTRQSISDSCGILDRLVHNAYKVELKGESMRKKRTVLDRKTEPVTECSP